MNYLKMIKEALVIVDMNNGFTKEGLFKNPDMVKLIPKINELALKFDDREDRGIILLNDVHTKDSVEFDTFGGEDKIPHCVDGTSEAEYVKELKWITQKYPMFKKNATMGAFAKNEEGTYIFDFYEELENLETLYFVGGITDVCVFENALFAKKYFDEINRRVNVEIIENYVETYDAPWHPRNEYEKAAYLLATQAGIEVRRIK